MPRDDHPPLAVEQLTKRYGTADAVHDLTFTVSPGRVTGFLGPNGAGKTTTMRALLGLIEPTSGRTLVHGRPYRHLPDPARKVGALLDGTEAHPAMTGRRNLQVRAAAAGVPDARVDEVLDMVGLTGAAGRRVGGYSLGMRQRLGLAGALLGDPQVLVLDEPGNGLDPDGVRWIRTFLRYLADEGRTVFVSSHMLAEVSRMADEVIVINDGRFVAHAPVAELMVDEHVLVRTPDGERFQRALLDRGATVSDGDDPLVVAGLPVEQVGQLASDLGIVLHELRARDADLESAFFDLVGTPQETTP